VVTRGSTYENRANLEPAFLDQIIRKIRGTRLGRQELEAELLDDVPGALRSRGVIEAARAGDAPTLVRVVVAIDPAATSSEDADEIGMFVAGKDGQGGVGCSPTRPAAIRRRNEQRPPLQPIARTAPTGLSPRSTTAARWSKRPCA